MPGVIREDRWIRGPVFVELGRELDEVARHAAEHRIANIGKHRMQGVTEFVEHRRHIVETEQRRLPRTGLSEVTDIDYHRPCVKQVALIDKAVLPGAAVFV